MVLALLDRVAFGTSVDGVLTAVEGRFMGLDVGVVADDDNWDFSGKKKVEM